MELLTSVVFLYFCSTCTSVILGSIKRQAMYVFTKLYMQTIAIQRPISLPQEHLTVCSMVKILTVNSCINIIFEPVHGQVIVGLSHSLGTRSCQDSSHNLMVASEVGSVDDNVEEKHRKGGQG